MKCYICPRECGADRDLGQLGVCGVGNKIQIARAALHMWEEPCISGEEGSGAVFFRGCSLRCVYCQNYEINKGISSPEAAFSVSALADVYLKLQKEGANNINLVTPSHYLLQVIDSVNKARVRGLVLPIVYNCSGYEKEESLQLLEGIVDIYLTDFKYMDEAIAMEYSNAKNYPEIAKSALAEMVRQQPEIKFNEKGIMEKGVIVRNLLLPNHVNNSKEVCRYVYETYRDDVILSIMSQYTPLEQVKDIADLNRKVTKREYNRLIDYVLELGARNVFIQEGDVAKESFIPSWE